MSNYDFTPWLILLCAATTIWVCRRPIASYLLARFDDLFSDEGARDREERDGALAVESPSSGLPEVLRPIGGLPSWESTRRDR